MCWCNFKEYYLETHGKKNLAFFDEQKFKVVPNQRRPPSPRKTFTSYSLSLPITMMMMRDDQCLLDTS